MSDQSFSLGKDQSAKLQKKLKQGEIIPVQVLNYTGDNIYVILIKNLEVKAFSNIDLRTKLLFVKVKELYPLPNLQLIVNDPDSDQYDILNSFADLNIAFNESDLDLISYLGTLKKNFVLSQNILFDLYHSFQNKLRFSLIPKNIFFSSALGDINTFYDFIEIYNPNRIINKELDDLIEQTPHFNILQMSHLLTNNEKFLFRLQSALKSMNKILQNTPYRLEQWIIIRNNHALIIPVEYLINQNNEIIKSQCFLNTQHLGLFHIYSQGNTLSFEVENNTILKHLETSFSDISQFIHQKYPTLVCKPGVMKFVINTVS